MVYGSKRLLARSRVESLVKENKSITRKSALAMLSVGLAAFVLFGWIVISHSGTSVSARASAEGRSIALQLPGVVLRQGGNGMGMQGMVANCAKGFVRRGSVCEVDAAARLILPAASNRSVRPPEHE